MEENKILIDRGKHSEIYLTDKGTIIKKFKENLKKNYEKEKYFLSILKDFSFVPKLISYNDDRLEIEMEYIRGQNLKFLIVNKKLEDLLYTISNAMDILHILDKLRIQKEEFTRPYKHIILTKNYRIVLIDWERSKIKNNPSNVTQFVSFLINNKNIKELLDIKKTTEIEQLLKEYKKWYSYEILNNLKCNLLCNTR